MDNESNFILIVSISVAILLLILLILLFSYFFYKRRVKFYPTKNLKIRHLKGFHELMKDNFAPRNYPLNDGTLKKSLHPSDLTLCLMSELSYKIFRVLDVMESNEGYQQKLNETQKILSSFGITTNYSDSDPDDPELMALAPGRCKSQTRSILTILKETFSPGPKQTSNIQADFGTEKDIFIDFNEHDVQIDGYSLLSVIDEDGFHALMFHKAESENNWTQIVFSFAGTSISELTDIEADLRGVVRNKLTPQINSACTTVLQLLQPIINLISSQNLQISLTGHSLGGWLAQTATFAVKHLELSTEAGFIAKQRFRPLQRCHPHCVVFDSPGAFEILKKISRPFISEEMELGKKEILNLDVTNYVITSNLVNVNNEQIGFLCQLGSEKSDSNHGFIQTAQSHKLSNFTFALSNPLVEKRRLIIFPMTTRGADTDMDHSSQGPWKYLSVAKDAVVTGFLYFFRKSWTIEILKKESQACTAFYENFSREEKHLVKIIYEIIELKRAYKDSWVVVEGVFELISKIVLKFDEMESVVENGVEFGEEADLKMFKNAAIFLPELEQHLIQVKAVKDYVMKSQENLTAIYEEFNFDFEETPEQFFTSLTERINCHSIKLFTYKLSKFCDITYKNRFLLLNSSQLEDVRIELQTLEFVIIVGEDGRMFRNNFPSSKYIFLSNASDCRKLLKIAVNSLISNRTLCLQCKGREVKLNELLQTETDISDLLKLFEETDPVQLETLLSNKNSEKVVIGSASMPKSLAEHSSAYFSPNVEFQRKDLETLRIFSKNAVNILEFSSNKEEEFQCFGSKLTRVPTFSQNEYNALCNSSGTIVNWLTVGGKGEINWKKHYNPKIIQGRDLVLAEEKLEYKRKFEHPGNVHPEIITLSKGQSPIILIGEAGEGKTVFSLQFLWSKFYENNSTWFIFSELKNLYSEQLEKLSTPLNQQSVSNFLKNFLKIETPVDSFVFEKLFDHSGQLHFVLDAFDEIKTGVMQQQFLSVLNFLIKSSNSKIFVSSRHQEKPVLETCLNVPSLSLTDLNLDNYIEIYFQGMIPQNKELIQAFLSELNYQIHEHFKETWREFLGLPLILFLLAEEYFPILFAKVLSPEASLNISTYKITELYRRHFERKIKLWLEEKLKLHPDEGVMVQETEFNLRRAVQYLALRILDQDFSDDVLRSLIGEIPERHFDAAAKAGLVIKEGGGCKNQYQFSHKSFAEYFAAEFHYQLLYKEDIKKYQVEDFEQFFKRFQNIYESYGKMGLFETFLNEMLSRIEADREKEKKFKMEPKFICVLFQYASWNANHILANFLNLFEIDAEFLEYLLTLKFSPFYLFNKFSFPRSMLVGLRHLAKLKGVGPTEVEIFQKPGSLVEIELSNIFSLRDLAQFWNRIVDSSQKDVLIRAMPHLCLYVSLPNCLDSFNSWIENSIFDSKNNPAIELIEKSEVNGLLTLQNIPNEDWTNFRKVHGYSVELVTDFDFKSMLKWMPQGYDFFTFGYFESIKWLIRELVGQKIVSDKDFSQRLASDMAHFVSFYYAKAIIDGVND